MAWVSGILAAMVVSATPLPPIDEAQRAFITEQVEAIDVADAPGFAFGLVQDGEARFAAYRGLADLSHGLAVGEDTRFNIASNAKQFVALMALDLAAQGTIDLDADFRTYLPGALPKVDAPITVRQLITHRSGIRDIYDLLALTGVTWYERAFDTGDALKLLEGQRTLNFAPGSDMSYSNSNYALLAAMIGEVSGQAFPDYAQGMFAKLDMDETGWRGREGTIVPHVARGYGNWNGWQEQPSVANVWGDGGLYTTLDDLMAYEAQLQGAASGLDRTVLEESQAMPATGNYGYGLFHSETQGLPDLWHDGSTGAYGSYILRYPEQELALIAITNNSEVGIIPLVNAIALELLKDRLEPQPETAPGGDGPVVVPPSINVSPDRMAAWEGRFVNDETGTEIVFEHLEGARFRMTKNGRERAATLVRNDRITWNDYRLNAVRDEAGAIVGLSVDHARNRNVRFERVE